MQDHKIPPLNLSSQIKKIESAEVKLSKLTDFFAHLTEICRCNDCINVQFCRIYLKTAHPIGSRSGDETLWYTAFHTS